MCGHVGMYVCLYMSYISIYSKCYSFPQKCHGFEAKTKQADDARKWHTDRLTGLAKLTK